MLSVGNLRKSARKKLFSQISQKKLSQIFAENISVNLRFKICVISEKEIVLADIAENALAEIRRKYQRKSAFLNLRKSATEK